MNVRRFKACAVEGGRHLNLPVYALLPQHRHFRPFAGINKWRRDVFIQIKGQISTQPRILGIEQVLEFFPGTVGIVAKRLNAVAGFCPEALQIWARLIQNRLSGKQQPNPILVIQSTNDTRVISQPGTGELLENEISVFTAHLDNRTQLLIEEFTGKLGFVFREAIQLDIDTGSAGKAHFREGDE